MAGDIGGSGVGLAVGGVWIGFEWEFLISPLGCPKNGSHCWFAQPLGRARGPEYGASVGNGGVGGEPLDCRVVASRCTVRTGRGECRVDGAQR